MAVHELKQGELDLEAVLSSEIDEVRVDSLNCVTCSQRRWFCQARRVHLGSSCFLASQVPGQEWMESEAPCGDRSVPAENSSENDEFSMYDADAE